MLTNLHRISLGDFALFTQYAVIADETVIALEQWNLWKWNQVMKTRALSRCLCCLFRHEDLAVFELHGYHKVALKSRSLPWSRV